MLNRFFLLLIFFLIGGCASLPPESITAQEKIAEGIETARRNQILLIENFSESEKIRVRHHLEDTITGALRKKYGERTSYTPTELRAMMVEYSGDLRAEEKKTDEKKLRLLANTKDFFDDLVSMTRLNLDLLRQTVDFNKTYKAVFDQIKEKSKDGFAEILSK